MPDGVVGAPGSGNVSECGSGYHMRLLVSVVSSSMCQLVGVVGAIKETTGRERLM